MGRKPTAGRVEVRPSSLRVSFTLNGKTERETLRVNGKVLPPTPANLKMALRLAAQIDREITAGIFSYAEHFPDSPRAAAQPADTFGALAEAWLKTKGQLADATQDQYRNAVEMWKRIIGADRPVRELNYKLLSTKIGETEWASGKSANNYLIVLRGIIGFEFSGVKAPLNPMIGIENLPVARPRIDPFTAAERDAILADMKRHYDPRVWAYFAWAFYTGMRPEEIIALRWDAIDWRSGKARVERVRTFKGSEREGAKTLEGVRDVDLLGLALEALAIMEPYTRMKKPLDTGDVFEHPVLGKPWHDERSQRDTFWKPSLRRVGLRQRRAYTTRHTYATLALMGGVNPAYVALQMGHVDTQMFFKTYARWLPDADDGAARRSLEKALAFSPKSPQPASESSNSLAANEKFGRRDWTRTNKPGG